MTFRELVNLTLHRNLPEFDRDAVKAALNMRYQMLWDSERWTFRQASATVNVAADSPEVTDLPDDFGNSLALERPDGSPLAAYSEYRLFASQYPGASGVAEAFWAGDGQLLVGPTPSAAGSYLLVYEKAATPLDGDDDEPAIPDGYQMALVYGARADGFLGVDGAVSELYEARYERALNAMRRSYLVTERGVVAQAAAYRPC